MAEEGPDHPKFQDDTAGWRAPTPHRKILANTPQQAIRNTEPDVVMSQNEIEQRCVTLSSARNFPSKKLIRHIVAHAKNSPQALLPVAGQAKPKLPERGGGGMDAYSTTRPCTENVTARTSHSVMR